MFCLLRILTVNPSNTDVELDQYACGMLGFYRVEVEACCPLSAIGFGSLFALAANVVAFAVYENVVRAEAEKEEALRLAAPASLQCRAGGLALRLHPCVRCGVMVQVRVRLAQCVVVVRCVVPGRLGLPPNWRVCLKRKGEEWSHGDLSPNRRYFTLVGPFTVARSSLDSRLCKPLDWTFGPQLSL